MDGGGLPMLNCLLQHTLRSLCSDSSSNSSKWVYSVFWRILPRNYPPPKWEFGGGAIDRAKGNKRNWILVWEDGYCDFFECERVGRFGPEVFFKMSHEVYSYGEGVVGKVAADNSHKWVSKEISNEAETNFISAWNMSIEPQPKVWEAQFDSGIQTIAVIAVREGIVQLGSLDKIVEDLNLVISIQRSFNYLQSIPGIFAVQRPYLPLQHLKPDCHETSSYLADKNRHLTGAKRLFDKIPFEPDGPSIKSINLGWNSPLNGSPMWPIPSLLPGVSCGLGALRSKLPYNSVQPYNSNEDDGLTNGVEVCGVKVEPSCHLDSINMIREEKPRPTNLNKGVKDQVFGGLGSL